MRGKSVFGHTRRVTWNLVLTVQLLMLMYFAQLQYQFVHLALLKAFTIGTTTVPVRQCSSKYVSWKILDASSEKTMLEVQFKDIEETKTETEEEGMFLSTAKYRVMSNAVIESKLKEMEAVYVDSWKRADAFMWTRLLDDPEDFWKLRKDRKSGIIIYIESAQVSSDKFLPSPEKSIALENSKLSMVSETEDDYGRRCIVTETDDMAENIYTNVQLNQDDESIYQNTETCLNKTRLTVFWLNEPNEQQWTNAEALLSLFNQIESARAKDAATSLPVMITSRCSCSVVGYLIAILNAIEMIKFEKEIDLYQIVLNIRKSKPEFFSSLSSYEDLHDFIDRYIKLSMV